MVIVRAPMNDRLPIYEIENEIVARLKTDRRLILSAPTGSGKSTQVPQMLLDAGLADSPAARRKIIVLQPRRVAARTVAARVAWERNVRLGDEVGYQIKNVIRTVECELKFLSHFFVC